MPSLKSIRTKVDQVIFDVSYRKTSSLMKKVLRNKLTYLELTALRDLVEVALKNEADQIAGSIIEAGCALGGSAIALASAKHQDRSLYAYDVFGMIPPPSERDDQDIHERYQVIVSGRSEGIDGHKYYGYEENLYEKVGQSFIEYGVEPAANSIHLIKGRFEEMLQVSAPVSLAHIDCDWYDSVQICLHQIVPNLVSGGTLVIDDYYSWSGCKKATDDYFESCKSDFKFIEKSRLHIIKI
jgi:hypothetical protein